MEHNFRECRIFSLRLPAKRAILHLNTIPIQFAHVRPYVRTHVSYV